MSINRYTYTIRFYSPSSCSKHVCISFFCWTQKDILRNIANQFLVPTDFHSLFSPILWKSMGTSNCLATHSLIQVWNYLRVSKWWQHFNFWVNYHFNLGHNSCWEIEQMQEMTDLHILMRHKTNKQSSVYCTCCTSTGTVVKRLEIYWVWMEESKDIITSTSTY